MLPRKREGQEGGTVRSNSYITVAIESGGHIFTRKGNFPNIIVAWHRRGVDWEDARRSHVQGLRLLVAAFRPFS